MLSRFIIPPLTVEQFVEQLVTRYNMTEAAELIRGTIETVAVGHRHRREHHRYG
jgi:hypothetical protein